MTARYSGSASVHVRSESGEPYHWTAYRFDFGFGDEWDASLWHDARPPLALTAQGSRADVLAMVGAGPADVPRPPDGWLAGLDVLDGAA